MKFRILMLLSGTSGLWVAISLVIFSLRWWFKVGIENMHILEVFSDTSLKVALFCLLGIFSLISVALLLAGVFGEESDVKEADDG